jgi:serine/threonine protein phosphatase 1
MSSSLTYAVGDIHGRHDLLERALERIARHSRGAPGKVIFLGDYVDRGPDSRRVVETLMEVQKSGAAICLKGNHEDMMVRALTDAGRTSYWHWCDNGGRETLRSYGVSHDDEARQIVPREHLRWMAGLPLSTSEGGRIYVHAGLAPKTPFHRQTEATCLWIRERFLRARAKDFEAHVVHGHTPTWEGKPEPSEPELLPHRTNLDTAAFASGVLSIGVFDPAGAGGPAEVLAVEGEPARAAAAELIEPAGLR